MTLSTQLFNTSHLTDNKLLQKLILGCGLTLVLASMFVFLCSFFSMAVAALCILAILEKLFGIKIIPPNLQY